MLHAVKFKLATKYDIAALCVVPAWIGWSFSRRGDGDDENHPSLGTRRLSLSTAQSLSQKVGRANNCAIAWKWILNARRERKILKSFGVNLPLSRGECLTKSDATSTTMRFISKFCSTYCSKRTTRARRAISYKSLCVHLSRRLLLMFLHVFVHVVFESWASCETK